MPACLQSAVGLRVGHRDVDIVVLDDCSPEEGWSEELRGLCGSLDIGYYRSPRNLGIPRNMNLALLRAMSGGYDYVFIVNSDVVMPMNLVGAMIRVAEADPGIGPVTAWSNNASIFSIPNNDDQGFLRRQETVDWISAVLESEFGPLAVDVPTGVGFCMLLPVPVVRRVGLFDPIYGRGYCEEVDWSLRSRARGYRPVLAPSTFVFHLGSGSTAAAGMVSFGHTTVEQHEQIVDLRYPSYRADLQAFADTRLLPALHRRALRSVIAAAARRWGYEVEAAWLPAPAGNDRVRIVVHPDGPDAGLSARFAGFNLSVDAPNDDVVGAVLALTGQPPAEVTVLDRGRFADQVSAAWENTVPFADRYRYPQRV